MEEGFALCLCRAGFASSLLLGDRENGGGGSQGGGSWGVFPSCLGMAFSIGCLEC